MAISSSIVVTHLSGLDATDARTPLVVRGRAAGLAGWLLTTLKLSPDVELTLGETEVALRTAGLRGVHRAVVPLTQVASTNCGYHKPLWLLVLGVLAVLGGLTQLDEGIAAALLYVLVGAGLVAWYVLKKATVLTVETTGGAVYGLAFSRSVIERVNVDLETAEQMVARLNRQVVGATVRERSYLRVA